MTVIKLCTHCVASEAQLLAFDIKYPESVEVPSQLKLTRGDQLHIVAGEDCYQCGKQCDTCDEEWNDTHTYDGPGGEEALDTLYELMANDTPQKFQQERYGFFSGLSMGEWMAAMGIDNE